MFATMKMSTTRGFVAPMPEAPVTEPFIEPSEEPQAPPFDEPSEEPGIAPEEAPEAQPAPADEPYTLPVRPLEDPRPKA